MGRSGNLIIEGCRNPLAVKKKSSAASTCVVTKLMCPLSLYRSPGTGVRFMSLVYKCTV
jgi:hypothetical protein